MSPTNRSDSSTTVHPGRSTTPSEPAQPADPKGTTSMCTTENYVVTGMTCGHCVMSVTEELTAVQGVTDVQVDLASGQVRVTSEQPVSTEQVREAVEEAGYSLAH